MAPTLTDLITAIAALAAGIGGREIVAGLVAWATGGDRRRRDSVREARAEADREADLRRRLQDYAWGIRGWCIQRHGSQPADFPPMPTSDDHEEEHR